MSPKLPLMESCPVVPQTEPQAAPPSAAAPSWLRTCLLPAVLSSALLWASYFPLAWGWLGWFALAPLLLLVRSQARPRAIYWCAWIGGSLFFWPVLQWMRVADHRMYATWAMLALYCSLYFPLSVYLIRLFERRTRLPLVLSVPLIWVALEYFRSVFGTGFGWYLIGYTQHQFLPIIQIADLGGVFAVSFVVVAVNALLVDVLYQIPAVRSFFHLAEPSQETQARGWDWGMLGFDALGRWRRRLPYEAIGLGALWLAVFAYGQYRLEQNQFRPGPLVALLQGNLDQRIRNQAATAQGAQQQILQEYYILNRLAFRLQPAPALLIWPETSFPMLWAEVDRDLPIDQVPDGWRDMARVSLKGVRDWTQGIGIDQLLGVNTVYLDQDGKPRNYNSALYVTRQGQINGRYDKMHRVPFGEYVPFRDWLPFMNWFAPYEHDYSIRSGEEFTRFELKGTREQTYRFGVLICYEDTVHHLGLHYAVPGEDGPPVDFLVNISNDGWFDGSSEHEEHLAISRFRAIETRRSLARAVNMGVSAVIDGNGRVLGPQLANAEEVAKDPANRPVWSVPEQAGSLPVRDWHQYKKTSGVLVAAIPLDQRSSLYAVVGDWLPALCWVTIMVVCLWTYVRHRRQAAVQAG